MVKPIPDYPDYMIYDDGRVWSNKTNKFLKPNNVGRGYLTVELFNNSGSKRLLIHRLVQLLLFRIRIIGHRSITKMKIRKIIAQLIWSGVRLDTT